MTATTIDARDIAVTRVLSMSTPDLGWLATGLLAATANDEIFGVKQHAHLFAEDGTAVATSTDGYRVHQMHVTLHQQVGRVDVVISRDALVWAKKNARTFKPKRDALIDPVAELVLEVPAIQDEKSPAGWVAVIFREWDSSDAPSARFDAPLVKESYPSVGRLIDGVRTSPEGEPGPLQLAFLAAAQSLETARTLPPTIQYTTRADGKQGPALLDFWEADVLRATALIQPSTGSEGDE